MRCRDAALGAVLQGYSTSGDLERNEVSDPGGIAATRLRPLRGRNVLCLRFPVVALRLPPANGCNPSGIDTLIQN